MKQNSTIRTIDICNSMGECPSSWVKEARHKRLCIIRLNFMSFWTRQNHRGRYQISDAKDWGWRERTDCKQKETSGVTVSGYMTDCLYLSKLIKIYNYKWQILFYMKSTSIIIPKVYDFGIIFTCVCFWRFKVLTITKLTFTCILVFQNDGGTHRPGCAQGGIICKFLLPCVLKYFKVVKTPASE